MYGRLPYNVPNLQEPVMPAAQRINDRLDFRLERQKKEMIERAAAAQGLSVTDFAVLTLYREAQEVLRKDEVLVLSDADRDAFLAALDNPPAPNAKLRRAARRYKQAKANGTLR